MYVQINIFYTHHSNPPSIHINSPVARKRRGISLFLVARDVIRGCSGGLVKCIAAKGEIATTGF